MAVAELRLILVDHRTGQATETVGDLDAGELALPLEEFARTVLAPAWAALLDAVKRSDGEVVVHTPSGSVRIQDAREVEMQDLMNSLAAKGRGQ